MGPEKDNKSPVVEPYYLQVFESIHDVYELASRIDERVQSHTKKLDEIDKELDDLDKDIDKLQDRSHQVDLKLQELESNTNRQEGRWRTIGSYVMQIIWIVITAYLLYKLGLQAP